MTKQMEDGIAKALEIKNGNGLSVGSQMYNEIARLNGVIEQLKFAISVLLTDKHFVTDYPNYTKELKKLIE